MNIRSITGFMPLADPLPAQPLRALGDFIHAARAEFERAGFPVQTARLATQIFHASAPRDLVSFARALENASQAHAINFVSLGALPGDHPLVPQLPAALAATSNVFASAHIAARETGIDLRAITAAAQIIRALADTTPDGFGNLRFAALANVPALAPFFPAAHHDGGTPAFALALEAAPLAGEAFAAACDLTQARANLIAAIERVCDPLAARARDLATRFDFRFAGIDVSLAPHPDMARSIGATIETLLGAEFGEHGTLFAAAFLTDCINRARFPRIGFSGLMLPVLEDAILGLRSPHYTLDSLLLYSTVCGTGLDTVPLPGDTTTGALAAILLDLATLAHKLAKPLTARLMPLPGLRAGDPTHFDFEYFANARVLPARARALKFFETDRQIAFQAKAADA